MGKLILIRHGETEWSKSGRHTGRTDVPLTAHGEAQAKSLSTFLSGRTIAHAFTSPLSRARRTAELAGVSPDIEPDLMEWNYGDYEGRTKRDILADRPAWELWRDGPAGGESVSAMAARIDGVIARVRPLVNGANGASGDVVLFAHGHALRMFSVRWLDLAPEYGMRFRLDPAAVCIFDGATLERWNDSPLLVPA